MFWLDGSTRQPTVTEHYFVSEQPLNWLLNVCKLCKLYVADISPISECQSQKGGAFKHFPVDRIYL